jgi:hypothetical protein
MSEKRMKRRSLLRAAAALPAAGFPSYVRFDHRRHAKAGVQWEACHGPVGQRVRMWREREMSMGSCMNYHRQMHASLDCGSCHAVR